jgi:hypothetical protein
MTEQNKWDKRYSGGLLLEGYNSSRQLDHGTGGPPVEDLLMEIAELKKELHLLHIIHGTEWREKYMKDDCIPGLERLSNSLQ